MPNAVTQLLADLTERFGDRFDVAAERLAPRRGDVVKAGACGVTDLSCALCDAPADTCDTCDMPDVVCKQQNDIACITCDEGDTGPACVPGIGDIPCGTKDV